ncbi:MAG: hypothetical protein R2778_08345 [Saprospiraceae bacterium]
MKAIYTTLFVILLTASAIAQNTSENFIIPKTNSKAVIQQTIASTQIEVTYNRPNKRDAKYSGTWFLTTRFENGRRRCHRNIF